MFTGSNKIVKPAGQQPDAFEQQVAQELFNLEVRARHTAGRCGGGGGPAPAWLGGKDVFWGPKRADTCVPPPPRPRWAT